MATEGPVPDVSMFAYRLPWRLPMEVVPAAVRREWMDGTEFGNANHCLPLLLANQAGWWILNSHDFVASWDGGDSPESLSITYESSAHPYPAGSYFGYGILSFTMSYLFRIAHGWAILVRGPANAPRDGISPLEGVVESDWAPMTFTMNWKFTRADATVAFRRDEPICMLVPQRRGNLEAINPVIDAVDKMPDYETYMKWRQSRIKFKDEKPVTVPGWQGDYMRGQSPDQDEVAVHQRRLKLRTFADHDDSYCCLTDWRLTMWNWTAESYGDEWADEYDSRFSFLSDETVLVSGSLHEMAGLDGAVLELGVGTGRIAIPLARRGIRVVGLEASRRMLDVLRGKEGGDLVEAVKGNFSDFDLNEQFSVVFMSCNTLYALPSQDLQAACLRCAARHLKDDGLLVVEVGAPSVYAQAPSVQAGGFTPDSATVELISHDAVAQQVHRLRISLSGNGVRLKSVFNRYIWPSELDLMGKLAGLELRFRWAGWDKGTFTDRSTGHVSGYGPMALS